MNSNETSLEENTSTASNAASSTEHPEPSVVIITGMSGAGRTEAVHTFEDLGYFCIDNLPPELIMSIVGLASLPGQSSGPRKLAIACPIRTQDYYDALVKELANLDAAGISYRIVFLDSTDDVLIARYKASRRLHPLSVENNLSIAQAVARERELNKNLTKLAHSYIDTSKISVKTLRERLRELYSVETKREGLNVVVYSFGFKHGAPMDADIVIDVRFLPNPFYIPEMRVLTGLDEPVHDFVLCNTETEAFLGAWKNLLDCVMPGYVAEGKHHLAIAVGCTGGQHRSVVLAEQTAKMLSEEGYNVTVYHRDITLADTGEAATK